MAIQKFTFLDEVGVQSLSTSLMEKTNLKIDQRILTDLEAATDKHVPSALLIKTIKTALETADKTNADKITALEGAVGESGNIDTRLTTIEAAVDTNKTDIGTIKDTTIPAVEKSVSDLETKVDSLTHLTISTVVGPITDVTNPSSSILYLQKDTNEDPTWVMYIYSAPATEDEVGTWIVIGDTSIDLVNYWSKDDVEEMKEALGMHDVAPLTEAQITTAVDTAYNETDPFGQDL